MLSSDVTSNAGGSASNVARTLSSAFGLEEAVVGLHALNSLTSNALKSL
jgi:hypothetical protein